MMLRKNQFVDAESFPLRHRTDEYKTVHRRRCLIANLIATYNCQTPTAIKKAAKQMRKIPSSVLPANKAPAMAHTEAGITIHPKPVVFISLFLA